MDQDQAKNQNGDSEICPLDLDELVDNEENENNKELSVVITTDFFPVQHAIPIKKKDTKFRSIYTKNMQVKLPSLKWLPGEMLFLRGNDGDKAIYDKFKDSVNQFKIVSMMIYAEEDPVYDMGAITFSTPLLTVFFYISSKRSIQIPKEILLIISGSDITIIMPGKFDWHYTLQKDHFERIQDMSSESIGFAGKVVELANYRELLHICNTGKGVCEHMKMIYWLFQVKIDSQLHGNKIPQNPSGNWKALLDHYGKLLIYEYWALNEKLAKYNQSPKNGVDTSPIYLEDLLIRYGIVTDMDHNDLRNKLLGGRKYPNPPLPNLPG